MQKFLDDTAIVSCISGGQEAGGGLSAIMPAAG